MCCMQQTHTQLTIEGRSCLYLPLCALGMWGIGAEEMAGRFLVWQAGGRSEGNRSDKSQVEELECFPCRWLSCSTLLLYLRYARAPPPAPTYLGAMSGVRGGLARTTGSSAEPTRDTGVVWECVGVLEGGREGVVHVSCMCVAQPLTWTPLASFEWRRVPEHCARPSCTLGIALHEASPSPIYTLRLAFTCLERWPGGVHQHWLQGIEHATGCE